VNLSEVMDHLHGHFTQLQRDKQAEGAGDPVFALEHPLSLEQVDELGAELSRTLLAARGPRDQYWLAWVVHAAEQGYGFGGLQYWDSFADNTPGWATFGDRDQLRLWFHRFHQRYGGLVPSGRWSENYTYICWPVGHALLPRDLQLQLAESIYNARYDLDLAPILPSRDLGALIARYTYAASTRYAGFLEQADLAGRIVRAMLAEDSSQQRTIYAPTLERISADLTNISHARDWMSDARQHYAEASFRMRHGTRTAGAARPATEREHHPVTPAIQPSLTPRFTLDRKGAALWRASLAPPSLQGLCSLRPELRSAVQSGSFRIDSHGDRLMPSAALLAGQPAPRPLARWPLPGEVLLRFDPPHPGLAALLAAPCRLTPGPVWLFRLRDRDTAELSERPVALPGVSYIVCYADAARIADLGEAIDLGLPELRAVRLDMPARVTSELRARLANAGIELRQTIRVTPVGLTPRRWSSAGEGEWLTNERPTFLLEHDHELAHYSLALDDAPVQVVVCSDDQPVLVALDRLSVGSHSLTIQAHEGPSESRSHLGRVTASCEIALAIRNPAAWLPGTLCNEAFVVDVNPREPSLDDVFSGELSVHLDGDPARSVTCELVLLDNSGETWLSEALFKHRFPITASTWSTALSNFLHRQTDDKEWFSASAAYLRFDAGELGCHQVSLRLDARPVRWALRREGKRLVLRIIDEAEMEGYLARRYTFATPALPEELEMAPLLAGADVSARGGLYALETETHTQAVVIAPVESRIDLKSLGAAIDTTALHKVDDPVRLAQLITLWHGARASSALARMKQRAVVKALHRQLLCVVCGDAWMHLEDRLSATAPQELWERLDRAVYPGGTISFAVSLSRCLTAELATVDELPQRLAAIAHGYKLDIATHPAALAWIIANSPERMAECGADWAVWVQQDAARALVRGARLLALGAELRRGNAA
jgi:hypothetical protein